MIKDLVEKIEGISEKAGEEEQSDKNGAINRGLVGCQKETKGGEQERAACFRLF